MNRTTKYLTQNRLARLEEELRQAERIIGALQTRGREELQALVWWYGRREGLQFAVRLIRDGGGEQ